MPGSTDFQQFNPGSANQLSTSAYIANTLRSGGITTAALFPSNLGNKLFYQLATFVAALAQALANKGYVLSDANFSTLVAVLANVKTTADFPASIQTVTYSGTIAFDATQGSEIWLTLTGNVSSSTLTGQVAGQQLLFIVTQDGTGGRTFSPPASITGFGTVSPVANVTSIQLFVVRPDAVIDPVTPMLYVSASGILAQAPCGIVQINSSGNVSSAYQEITEIVDASGGAITRTLFDATLFKGFKVNMLKKDISTNAVTAATVGGQTIDSFPNLVNSVQFNSYTFQSDGANWWII